MKLAFVIGPQSLLTGIALPVEMFYAASRHRVRHRSSTPLSIQLVGETLQPQRAIGGLNIQADHTFEQADNADLVFVPPMWGTPWPVISKAQALQNWLVEQYQQGARLAATGTGVGHLARAGLLDNRVATTHWYYLDRFRQRYPQVKFEGHHFVTHEDGLYCAGSINAQTDLVLFLIEQTFGEEALALVERQFMHELKRTFSTPYFEPGGAVHHDEGVSLVQSWIRQHLTEDITLMNLAALVDQSSRNFSRRFQAATGESPMAYVLRLRLDSARELLRDTNLTVAEVGEACGFRTAAYFGRVFRERLSMTPGEYRKMVRSKLFTAG
ncbi:helix-turn-helix domain-containing protein [Saccharospirillum sp. HFRX-1]|uniref:GlxA family transcriptional regulator n=1 Tax=unclassified Saccharospirillum TaxID=2633430 RepID=UPI00371C015B